MTHHQKLLSGRSKPFTILKRLITYIFHSLVIIREVLILCIINCNVGIHSKSEQIGGTFEQRKIGGKSAYKISGQTCVYHENIINLVTK